MNRSITRFRGVAAALWLLLSGCAVLTVDVDVYKGALVNEEHVQLHQLVALATAAKPLLVQLRDNLEWPDSDGLPPKGETGKRSSESSGWLAEQISPSACPSTDSWYKPKYVQPPDGFVPEYKSGGRTVWEALPFVKPTCQGFFTRSHARLVNEILKLYEDFGENGEVLTQQDTCFDKVDTQDRSKPTPKVAIKGLTSRLAKPSSTKKTKGDCHAPVSMEETNATQHVLDHEDFEKLVEFAQKVLFVANHDGLLNPASSSGLIVGGLADLNRALFGDALTDYKFSPYRIFQLDTLDAKRTQYVRVLQAVGNSILFSTNELRERDRYRDLSKKRVPVEIAAVNAVYSPDPRKVLNDLVKELRAEQVLAQQQLDEAMANKAVVDEQIKNAASLKTEADDEVNKATQALNDYRAKLSPLKAIHDLVTPQVAEQIEKGWTVAKAGHAADLADFLTGLAGLDKQLDAIRLAQDGTLTPEERSLFDQAIACAKAPESKEAFEAYRTLHGLTSLTRAELLTAFTAHLRELEAARAARATEYEKIRKEKEEARRDVQAKSKQLNAESVRLAALITELPVTKAKLATAEKVIEAVKDEVLKAAPTDAPYVSPDTIYAFLTSHVQHKEVAEQDTAKKKAYQDTQAVLSKRTPPPALPPLKDGDYRNPVEVMDQVIALLRHRQMEAVERFGKDSDEDKKATDALENAYQHRAGMIYLRPSSAYLRTSFPSTSLQNDPNLAWDNMLLSQGIRNLPFSSQLADIFNPSEKQDRTLTAELDKQYWQNINRVRVSGAGRTNQALVKDDVGNWYVKHYFGDTERIVKSAKHLALFGLGTKLPIDLSHELRKASITKDDSKKSESEKAAELPPLQQVFLKHRTAYQAHTVEMSTRLAELHGKDGTKALYNQILAGWESHDELKNNPAAMTALKTALGEEVAQWDKNVEPLKKASDQERGLAITKDLKALAKLEKRLSARIEQDVKAESSKAASEVRKVVGMELLGMLKDHKQALDRYEQAVLFIGDAANPKDPKQEQGK